MEKLVCVAVVSMVFCLAPIKTKAQDPVTAAIKQAVIKVIKAIDLQIQRFQNETIWLQNAQKTLENTMSKLKLDEISNWVERQRKLYDDYFQELWQVKAVVSSYYRVKDIIALEARIVNEYKNAYALFKGDKNFTREEIENMHLFYNGLLAESLRNLDQVYLVVNSFLTQMSDARRREIINNVYENLQQNLSDLRQYNIQNKLYSFQISSDKSEIERLKLYYGIK